MHPLFVLYYFLKYVTLNVKFEGNNFDKASFIFSWYTQFVFNMLKNSVHIFPGSLCSTNTHQGPHSLISSEQSPPHLSFTVRVCKHVHKVVHTNVCPCMWRAEFTAIWFQQHFPLYFENYFFEIINPFPFPFLSPGTHIHSLLSFKCRLFKNELLYVYVCECWGGECVMERSLQKITTIKVSSCGDRSQLIHL